MTAGLVEARWLSSHLNDPELVVLDARLRLVTDSAGMVPVSGAADYASGHLPGAVHADLLTLSDPSSSLMFALPEPDAFCTALGRLGVGEDTHVVVYDAAAPMWAARLWWMLRWVGVEQASILDGGLAAWSAIGGAISTIPVEPIPRRLTPQTREAGMVDRAELLAALQDSEVRLLDTLPREHYLGETSWYSRPGHLPGALSLPFAELFDEQGTLRRDQHPVARLVDGQRTVAYCGAGIAASSVAWALTVLGHDNVAVYPASLQEWAADESLPLVVGDSPHA